MKYTKLLLTLTLASSSSLSAAILLNDAFAYDVGALGSTATTGTGFQGNWGAYLAPWNDLGFDNSSHVITSGSLTGPTGYNLTPTGNKLSVDTAAVLNTTGTVGVASGIDFSQNGTYYFSYLTTAFANGSTSGSIQFLASGGGNIFTIGELSSTSGELGLQAGATSDTSTRNMDLDGANSNGYTSLVVARLDVSASGNDTVSASFWVSGTDFVTPEPSAWDASITFNSSETLTGLRFDAENGYAGLEVSFDEVILGTSFEDVTGVAAIAVPEPRAYAAMAGLAGLFLVLYRRRKQT